MGGEDEEIREALGGFVGCVGGEGLGVVWGESGRQGGDAGDPDYTRGGREKRCQPVREHVVAEDVCCEDLAQLGFFFGLLLWLSI